MALRRWQGSQRCLHKRGYNLRYVPQSTNVISKGDSNCPMFGCVDLSGLQPPRTHKGPPVERCPILNWPDLWTYQRDDAQTGTPKTTQTAGSYILVLRPQTREKPETMVFDPGVYTKLYYIILHHPIIYHARIYHTILYQIVGSFNLCGLWNPTNYRRPGTRSGASEWTTAAASRKIHPPGGRQSGPEQIQVNTHVHTYIIYIYTYLYTYIYIYVQLCTCTFPHTYIHTCICTCRIHIYIYKHVLTQAYVHVCERIVYGFYL